MRYKALILAFSFLSLSLFAIANEQNIDVEDFNLAIKYKSEGDLKKALDLLNKLSESRNAEADYTLGQFYEKGEGVSRNFTKAFQHFLNAANNGHAPAQRKLGYFYDTGKGINESRAEAYLYYTFATFADDQEASIILGYKHLMGYSVPASCDVGVAYYHQVASELIDSIPHGYGMTFLLDHPRLVEYDSGRDRTSERQDIVMYYQYTADSGDAEAQVSLGNLYLQGVYGVQVNYETALYYFRLAAAQGDPSGLCNLGYMYANGLGVKSNNETAIHYYQRAIEKENPQALNNLGYMLLNGIGIEKNFMKGLEYLNHAVRKSHPDSLVHLALLYQNGEGVERDAQKAVQYLTLSASHGNLRAMYHLATLHLSSGDQPRSCSTAIKILKKFVEKVYTDKLMDDAFLTYESGDYARALHLYETAAEMGVEIAQSNAAFMYEKGVAPPDFAKDDLSRYRSAFRYYSMSSDQQSSSSHLKLGDFYYYGLGDLGSDFRKSVYHFRQASDLRHAQASFNLGYMHEHGLGLPKDFFLAKRFYDLASEFTGDATVPVALALAWLRIHSIYESLDSFSLFDSETVTLIVLAVSLILLFLLRRRF